MKVFLAFVFFAILLLPHGPHLIRVADGKVRVSLVKGVRTNQPYFYPYAALLKCIIGRIFLIKYEY